MPTVVAYVGLFTEEETESLTQRLDLPHFTSQTITKDENSSHVPKRLAPPSQTRSLGPAAGPLFMIMTIKETHLKHGSGLIQTRPIVTVMV